MGLLVDIRESWKTFLETDVESGSQAYFSATPAIPVQTEKLKTVEQAIKEAIASVGLSVMITTVTARDAQNQLPGLWFGKILCVARIYENPTLNQTGVCCSDLAEAVAWFTRKFTPEAGAMILHDIILSPNPHPAPLGYDVLYSVEAGIERPPQRPNHCPHHHR